MEFLKLLESIRTPFGDAFFLFVTNGGEEIMLFGVLCLLYWCIDKKLAYRMAFVYLTSGLAVNTTKLVCRVERPWVRDPSFTAVEKAKKTATGYSFPSGHTQNATALFGTLAYSAKKLWLRILFFLIIPMVMTSRMYLGVHTPADVCTSFAISFVIVLCMNKLADKMTFTHKKRVIVAAGLILIAISVILYTAYLLANGTIAIGDASDSFKGYGAGLAFALCWVLENRYVDFSPSCDALWKQILKVILGMGVLLLMKELLKHAFPYVFGDSTFGILFANALRYFILMFWAMLGMPVIIKKYFQNSKAK